MIKLTQVVFLMFFSVTAFSQSSFPIRGKPVSLGLEVLQSIPSFVFSEKYWIQKTIVVEPTLKFEVSDSKALLFTLGYVRGSTDMHEEVDKIPILKFGGSYFKVGFERSSRSKFPLTFGYGPIVSLPVYSGVFRFEGPVFGDYEGRIKNELHFAMGIHACVAVNANLNSRCSLRLYQQTAFLLKAGALRPLYYPGVGFTQTGKSAIFGLNGGLQFFYRLKTQ